MRLAPFLIVSAILGCASSSPAFDGGPTPDLDADTECGGIGEFCCNGTACSAGLVCESPVPICAAGTMNTADAGADAGDVPLHHRPAASSCSPETFPDGGIEDAGTCLTDSNCSDGGVCQCADAAADGGNVCLPGNCRIDSDCGDGGYCSPVESGCFPHLVDVAYDCHTPQDTCLNNSDCFMAGNICMYDPAKMHWLCGPVSCSGP